MCVSRIWTIFKHFTFSLSFTVLLHRPKLDQIRVNCLCVSNHPEGFTLNRQQVMMYSINELILSGCWKLGENTTHSKQSCPMDMRSEICVKRENAQPFLNSTDHQVAMGLLPIESSLQADLLSNTDRSLPEDFYEELVDPPIDQPPWVGIGKQPDKQVKKEVRMHFPWGIKRHAGYFHNQPAKVKCYAMCCRTF